MFRIYINILTLFVISGIATNITFSKENTIIPKKIIANFTHSCVLDQIGSLYCWDVALKDRFSSKAKRVANIPSLLDISSGYFFDCGLDTVNNVWCWRPEFREAGETYEIIELKKVNGFSSIQKIAAGFQHVCAIDGIGETYCWGSNAAGELGTGDKESSWEIAKAVKDLPRATAIGAGSNNSCAATMSGPVYCWGTDDPMGVRANRSLQPFELSSTLPHKLNDINDLVEIHNGRNFMCGIESSGYVVCWGSNISGQLGAPPELSWGKNQLKFPVSVQSLSVSHFNACAATTTGHVFCWGEWNEQEISPTILFPDLKDAEQISVNDNLVCILTKHQEIWCAGQKMRGSTAADLEWDYIEKPWRVILPSKE